MEAHTHDESCYALNTTQQLICGISGEDPEHTHTQQCYVTVEEEQLICSLPEHIHTDQCLSDPTADLETEEDWRRTFDQVLLSGCWAEDLAAIARTQIGYLESENNYQAEPSQGFRGYTRYGAWYGVPYGKWDAMFAAFCMHYADIPDSAMPFDPNTGQWYSLLLQAQLICTTEQSMPGVGDLLFFADAECSVSKVAVATAVNGQTVTVVEGDCGNRTMEYTLTLDGTEGLAGYVNMIALQAKEPAEETGATEDQTSPTETSTAGEQGTAEETEPVPEQTDPVEETTEPVPEPTQETWIQQSQQTENYIVTVTYSSALDLPEGAQLQVTEYAKDSDIFRQRCEEAGYELQWLLNIGFFLDGQELSVEGGFDVTVTAKQGQPLGTDITHFQDDGTQRINASEDEQDSVAFSTDGFSDFGGGTATLALESEPAAQSEYDAISYTFITVNPAQLQEGVDYVIYTGYGGSYNFLRSNLGNISASGSATWSPYNIGGTWSLSSSTMTTGNLSDIAWRVVKSGNQIYLVSQYNQQRLNIYNGGINLDGSGTALTVNASGAGATVGASRHLRFDNGWTGTWGNQWWTNDPTTVYFGQIVPTYPNYPDAVETGTVDINRLRFYNICEDENSGVRALAGCRFSIVGDNGYETEIVSGDAPEIDLPEDIPDGTYTISEIYVPEGYIRDSNHTRHFQIKNGNLVSEYNIGTFVNHSEGKFQTGKTGEVADYNNRIYQIMLTASSTMELYQMGPVDLLFLVDQSNSMLFPSAMSATGKYLTLQLDGTNNISRNQTVLDSLDKSKMHYLIADPTGSSTAFCIWHDGTNWMYQDASYYATAKFNNIEGYQTPGELAIFPINDSYSNQPDNVNGQKARANGGALDKSLAGSSLGKDIDLASNDIKTYQLYTANNEYNRLHYLEEALANLIYMLADANPQNRVTLVPFTKVVETQIEDPANPGSYLSMPMELNTTNAEKLVEVVTSINTSGGTRQDLALQYTYENYLRNNVDGKDRDYSYTVLITDGAPVKSDDKTLDQIYADIRNYGYQVRQESTLMSVALGMSNVQGGSAVLEEIASSNELYCPLDDASELVEAVEELLFKGFKPKGQMTVYGDVKDEISDSFYPVAWVNAGAASATGRKYLATSSGRDWVLLNSGDWITLEGKLTTAGAWDAAGQLLQDSDGTFFVQWNSQLFSGSTPWKGSIYLKAKEDFIGGNAIETNKDAAVTVFGMDVPQETPTVNVRLLEMNEFSSQITVYLGDLINGPESPPIDLLQEYYRNICFTKLVSDGRNVLNKVNAADGDGLEEAVFYLKYAIGRDLTVDEWNLLMEGNSITLPYLYDDPSSHGPVGEFTIRLTKDGTSADYYEHTATHACHPDGQPSVSSCPDPAETYTLSVVYDAFRLAENGRPTENQNNGTGSPGVEVGTGHTLTQGQGTVDSVNVHKVHVISGSIAVRKIIEDPLISQSDQVFTFTLHRTEDGADTTNDRTGTITVPAGSAYGSAMLTFSDLPRGTYTLTEAVSDTYALKQILVTEATNCQSSPAIGGTAPEVTFVLGNNTDGLDVIGYDSPSDRFTSYVDPVNGVYGEAVFTNGARIFTGEIPVEKAWDDDLDIHYSDQVYLLLLRDGIPVVDDQGRARLLRLDRSNSWKGVFTVVLSDKDDKVTDYNYTVREVRGVSDSPQHEWSSAILENDGTTLLYYDKPLEDGQLATFGGRSYVVRYTSDGDGNWTVSNLHAVELPKTGGIGTSFHTFGGTALIAAALMYICKTGRKRRKEAN